jgi:hypothetical protein
LRKDVRLQAGMGSLAFVFAFAEPFEDGEPGLLGVRDGQRFELGRRMELGDYFADRFLAERTLGEGRGVERTAEGELATADGTVAVAQFVFVEWHGYGRGVGSGGMRANIVLAGSMETARKQAVWLGSCAGGGKMVLSFSGEARKVFL